MQREPVSCWFYPDLSCSLCGRAVLRVGWARSTWAEGRSHVGGGVHIFNPGIASKAVALGPPTLHLRKLRLSGVKSVTQAQRSRAAPPQPRKGDTVQPGVGRPVVLWDPEAEGKRGDSASSIRACDSTGSLQRTEWRILVPSNPPPHTLLGHAY